MAKGSAAKERIRQNKERNRQKKKSAQKMRELERRRQQGARTKAATKAYTKGDPAAFAQTWSLGPRGEPLVVPEHYELLRQELNEVGIVSRVNLWVRAKPAVDYVQHSLMMYTYGLDKAFGIEAFPNSLFYRSDQELWLDEHSGHPVAWLRWEQAQEIGIPVVLAKSGAHPLAAWAITTQGAWLPLVNARQMMSHFGHDNWGPGSEDCSFLQLLPSVLPDLETFPLNPSRELDSALEYYRCILDEPIDDMEELMLWHAENEDLLEAFVERGETVSQLERSNDDLRRQIVAKAQKLEKIEADLASALRRFESSGPRASPEPPPDQTTVRLRALFR